MDTDLTIPARATHITSLPGGVVAGSASLLASLYKPPSPHSFTRTPEHPLSASLSSAPSLLASPRAISSSSRFASISFASRLRSRRSISTIFFVEYVVGFPPNLNFLNCWCGFRSAIRVIVWCHARFGNVELSECDDVWLCLVCWKLWCFLGWFGYLCLNWWIDW